MTQSVDPQAYIASVMAGLTGPGGRFEFVQEDVLGTTMPVMKNRDKALGDVLAGIDCLIQASPSEGGPLVALEAWCAGVPLISTDVGIIKDDRAHVAAVTTILPVDAPLSDWLKATKQACQPEQRPICESAAPKLQARYGANAMSRRWVPWLRRIAKGTA